MLPCRQKQNYQPRQKLVHVIVHPVMMHGGYGHMNGFDIGPGGGYGNSGYGSASGAYGGGNSGYGGGSGGNGYNDNNNGGY